MGPKRHLPLQIPMEIVAWAQVAFLGASIVSAGRLERRVVREARHRRRRPVGQLNRFVPNVRTLSVFVLQTRQSDHDHPTGRPIYDTPRKVKQRNPMVNVGLYPIVTFQYSSTTLSQFSYHIQ